MDHLKFSDNLRRALCENKISQQKFAAYLGTTQQTVSRWLQGINEPDLETLMNICLYLGETPNSLLGFDDISRNVIDEYDLTSK